MNQTIASKGFNLLLDSIDDLKLELQQYETNPEQSSDDEADAKMQVFDA